MQRTARTPFEEMPTTLLPPTGTLFDLPVNGRRVQFDENVFYEFAGGRIEKVWSIIDKASIARQL